MNITEILEKFDKHIDTAPHKTFRKESDFRNYITSFYRQEISTLLDSLKMEEVKPWQEMTEEWTNGHNAYREELNNKLNELKK
jgi:hypothetical protein